MMAPRNYILTPPTNPILQVLYFVIGGIVLIGAVLMGAVILSVALGLALIGGIVVYIRFWWLKHQLLRKRQATGGRSPDAASVEVLEVEYTVVSEDDDRDK